MLINSEGKPAQLYAIDGDIIWRHCFGDGPVLDSKKSRAVVTEILAAHNTAAEFCQPLKKR